MAREVSCRVISSYVEAFRQTGTPLESLVAGLPVTVKQVTRPSERVDWDSFCVMSERMEAVCGGPEGLARSERYFAKDPFILGLNTAMGLVTSSQTMFRAVDRWFGAAMFTVTSSSLEQVAPDTLRFTIRIDPDYRDCESFLRINALVFQVSPRLLGSTDAQVTCEVHPRKGVYLIRLPPSLTLWGRALRTLRVGLSPQRALLEVETQQKLLQERFEEVRVANRRIEAQAEQLRTVNALGRELAQYTELRALGDSVERLFQTTFGCTGLRLWLVRREGEPAEVVRITGRTEGAATRVFPLKVGGTLVGQIDAWGFSGEEGLGEALAPWISIALENARSFALLREYQAGLEQKVEERTSQLSQRTEELNASLERLRELDRQKTRFFANASHELRTPLTLMIAPLEALVEAPETPEGVREELRNVSRASYRLLKLVNDLLDLAKLEGGGMLLRMGTVELERLISDCVRPFRPMLQRRGVRVQLEVPTDLVTVADGERLEQVFLNLISNASKHVPDQGLIRISAQSCEGGVEVQVENSGEGVEPEDLERLFDRFAQALSSRGRRFGSTGLGLPLVRELVELHGGRLSVENHPGQSVAFKVTLPGGQGNRLTPISQPPRAGALELAQYEIMGQRELGEESPPHRVTGALPLLLVAEDNPELRAFLVRSLLGEYDVLEASDGQQALEVARARRPELILSDLMMPRLDGAQLCEAIKSDPELAGIPFVLLTARGDPTSKVEGLGKGADDYIVKPFHVEEVRARLRTQLRLRVLTRDLAHREKLAALGTVVAGVAHEIRNPLNGIINALAPLEELMEENPLGKELVTIALTGARRMDELSGRMLRQLRAGEGVRTDVQVEDSVRFAMQLLDHKAKKAGVRLTSQVPPEASVFGEPASLEQVWLNLIDNALYAAGTDGWVKVEGALQDGALTVEVRDGGAGIPPERLSRIFDPFFTTKPMGKGTGLGLSIVREIVESLGGTITVRSAAGEGACFRVSLPASAGAVKEPHAAVR